jgi:hypothetical protein
MKFIARTLAALALTATVGTGIATSANAQVIVAAPPATIIDRLSPTALRYVPGTVPSQCLAYATIPGAAPIVYCEGYPPTAADVQVQLFFSGEKPWGFRTPDACVLRHIPGTLTRGWMYCKGHAF